MKKTILAICAAILIVNSVFAQDNEPKLTKAEIREAQQLAARFYNRLAQTQDVAPLIKEFFIKDFGKRLKFCRTTGNCRGFAKDFWAEDESLTKWSVTESDFKRSYKFFVNYFYLFFRIAKFTKILNPIPSDLFEKETAEKIKTQLKNKPELLKYALYLAGEQNEDTEIELNTQKKFQNYYYNAEKLISELQILEKKVLLQVKSKNPTAKISYNLDDFTIYAEENKNSFFNFPSRTIILEAWSKDFDELMIPFRMDLIRENGKLKIIAIYPPMD